MRRTLGCAVTVLLLAVLVLPGRADAQYSRSPRAVKFDPSLALDTTRVIYAPGGLGTMELKAGSGVGVQSGQRVTVHYVGKLAATGKKFDASTDRNEPFVFTLGTAEVIRGWDLGVVGMKKGEKRLLVVPPALGYGNGGSPPDIPPGATLVFEVELLDFQ